MFNVTFSAISISMKYLKNPPGHSLFKKAEVCFDGFVWDLQNLFSSQKMSKEGNMESKKWFMYVSSRVRSDTHGAFYVCSPSLF